MLKPDSALVAGCARQWPVPVEDDLYTAGSMALSQIDPGSDVGILQACPRGITRLDDEEAPNTDPVWRGFCRMEKVWAGGHDIRFRAAAGCA